MTVRNIVTDIRSGKNLDLRTNTFMAKAKLTVTLVVLALFVVVVLQNTDIVTVKVLAWELTLSRIILLTAPLLIGFALGFVVAKIGSAVKHTRQESSIRKEHTP